MTPRGSKAVMAGLEKMTGATLAKRKAAIHREIVDPIREAIESATSPEDLRRRMSAALLKRMKVDAVADAIADAANQAALIGAITAPTKRNGKDADKSAE